MGLFNKIQEFLKSGKLIISKVRKDRPDSNLTVVLEFNQMSVLKTVIIPLFSINLFQISKDCVAGLLCASPTALPRAAKAEGCGVDKSKGNCFVDINKIEPVSFTECINFSPLQSKKQLDFCL